MSFNPMENCGYCGRTISKKEQETDTQYLKHCFLCTKNFRLKHSCALEMYRNSTTNNKARQINVTDFNNSSIALYCVNCRQKNCFYYNRTHLGKSN
jgi:hypothetical protein